MITVEDVQRAIKLLDIGDPRAILSNDDVFRYGMHLSPDKKYTSLQRLHGWTNVRAGDGKIHSFYSDFESFRAYWNDLVECIDHGLSKVIDKKLREIEAGRSAVNRLNNIKERIWDVTSELSS